MERLDKVVSVAMGCSRNDAKKLIQTGQVAVNGKLVNDTSFKTSPTDDLLTVNGTKAVYKKYIYIVMNKPDGVISAGNDKHCKTVIDILPPSLKRKGLFPVGRLDKTTTGLLLITDDGDFGHKLLSPAHKVPKTYIAILDAKINDDIIHGFENGVTLADGTTVAPAKLKIIEDFEVSITITEGKYHQIKRMFGVFDIGVNSLKRISFAGLALPCDILPGEARELSKTEFQTVKSTIIY